MYIFILDLKYFKSSVDQITEKKHLILFDTALQCYFQFMLQKFYLHRKQYTYKYSSQMSPTKCLRTDEFRTLLIYQNMLNTQCVKAEEETLCNTYMCV
jgi:hypothetical protein